MLCSSCGKRIYTITGMCSSCGHYADPIDFGTQLSAWAAAIAPEPVSKPAPAKKSSKKSAKASKVSKRSARSEPEPVPDSDE